MNLCSRGHDEVCFDSHHCPMCALKYDYDQDISSKDSRISELETEVEELQSEVNRFTRGQADGER